MPRPSETALKAALRRALKAAAALALGRRRTRSGLPSTAKRVEEERRRAVAAKVARTERAHAVALARTKAELAGHLTSYQPDGAKEAYPKEQNSGHMI